MQSSPPQRAWDPPSPATTKYSIDLAALELDSRSGASTPLPGQEIDKVLSEDIDGPSDFTQNMEMWMRGGSMRKGSTAQERLGSVKETTTEHRRDDALKTKAQDDEGEDVKTISNHTPTNSPPKTATFRDSAAHDDDGEEVASSMWEQDGEEQTPRSNGAKFQPTVEDYYSELNLIGTPPISARGPSNPLKGTASMFRAPRQSSGRASSPTLSPERTPAPVRPTSTSGAHRGSASLEQQIQDLAARCQQLEQLNAAMSDKLDEERHLREAESATHSARLAEAARREKDLSEMKSQSYSHKEDFRREFGELKERLRQRDIQQVKLEQEMKQLKADHEAKTSKLQAQVDDAKAEQEQEIQAMELELELQRRGRADFEEMARANREELDERRIEVDKMKLELQQGEDLREQIKEHLRVAKMDYEKLRSTMSPAQEMEKKTIEDLQQQLKEAKQLLRVEREAHERVQSSIPANDNNEELETLRTELNEATIERDELQDRLTAETEVKQKAVDRVEELEAVNKIMDAKVADAIKRREEQWRAKFDEMKAERRIMAKTLMRLWGRIECGPPDAEGRQPYKYMFPAKKDKKQQPQQQPKQPKEAQPKESTQPKPSKKEGVRFAL